MLSVRAKEYQAQFNEYTEFRVQKNSTQQIRLLGGRLIQNDVSCSEGISARVYNKGVYGFASTENTSIAEVKKMLFQAEKNAKLLGGIAGRNVKLPNISKRQYETPFIIRDVQQEELLALGREVDEYIKANCKGLTNRMVRVRVESVEKDLLVSEAVEAHTVFVRTHIFVFMYTEDKDGISVNLDDYFGDWGYPDVVFANKAPLFKWIDKLYSDIMAKKEGGYSESGFKDVILCPDLAGILAHEAVGHTVEADAVRSGSIAAFSLEKKVASEQVTLIDYANSGFGREMPFPIYVDDEGTFGEDAVVIENGILKGYLHSRESAYALGMKPQGNARADKFFDEPLVRMRNTIILPGKDSIEDMISAVDDGYMLAYPENGQGDVTGEFMFGASMGWKIKNGKIDKPIRNVTISGYAFELLKSIDMLSNDVIIRTGGTCGKKQLIGTSCGGPAIKCKANISGI